MNIIEVPEKKSKNKNISWLSNGTKIVNGRAYTPIEDFIQEFFDIVFYILLILIVLSLPAMGVLKFLTIQFPKSDLVNFQGFALSYCIIGLVIYCLGHLGKHYKKFINK